MTQDVSKLSIREALNLAMKEEMRRDPNVVLMGEDVALYEGAYKITRGMHKEFGDTRVIDTPISEAGFAGLSIGASMKGIRPIVEFMTFNFAMQAFDQIVNVAAKIHYMSGGTIGCPIVFRGPNGPAARVAATHSQCLASTFASYTGLKIVMISDAYNAKGLLKAAIRDDNPVIFLENEVAYGEKCMVPNEEYILPLGKGRIMQEGEQLTIITYGKMVGIAMQACAELPDYSIEIIDLQTLKPFDEEIIKKSVSKTHRVLCLEESLPFASIGSEIITWINQNLWDMLDEQPMKLSGLDIPMPYAKNLEEMACPNVNDVQRMIVDMLG